MDQLVRSVLALLVVPSDDQAAANSDYRIGSVASSVSAVVFAAMTRLECWTSRVFWVAGEWLMKPLTGPSLQWRSPVEAPTQPRREGVRSFVSC